MLPLTEKISLHSIPFFLKYSLFGNLVSVLELKIIDNKKNDNIKIEPPAIKSIIAESFKNLDKNILVFPRKIKAKYADNNHFDVDNNSFINPLDNPNRQEIAVNKMIMISVITIN